LTPFELQYWSPKIYRNASNKRCLARIDELLQYLASKLIEDYKPPIDPVDPDNVFCKSTYQAICKRKNHIIRQIEFHFGGEL
jgi:hypothetical protein